MREIKFRAWHPENKIMVIFDGKSLKDQFIAQHFALLVCGEHPDSASPLMQYTGLKDFFENEIYEGDIVFLDSQMRNYEIVMDCGAWKLKCMDQFDKECFEWLCDYYGDLHVVGNTYENPEMLNIGE